MICPRCGAESSGNRFCTACGAAFTASSAGRESDALTRQPATTATPAAFPMTAVTDPAAPLGLPLTANAGRWGGGPPSPQKTSAGWWAVVIVGVAAVLGAGTFGIIAITHSNPPAVAGTTTTTTASQPTDTSSPNTSEAPTTTTAPGTADTTQVSQDPQAGPVEQTMSAYFQGVDAQDYPGAYAVYDPAEQAKFDESGWAQGDSTTQDTGVIVRALSGNPDGSVDATVAFVSHQQAAYAWNKQDLCDDWTLVYHLLPAVSGAVTPLQIDNVHPMGNPSAC